MCEIFFFLFFWTRFLRDEFPGNQPILKLEATRNESYECRNKNPKVGRRDGLAALMELTISRDKNLVEPRQEATGRLPVCSHKLLPISQDLDMYVYIQVAHRQPINGCFAILDNGQRRFPSFGPGETAFARQVSLTSLLGLGSDVIILYLQSQISNTNSHLSTSPLVQAVASRVSSRVFWQLPPVPPRCRRSALPQDCETGRETKWEQKNTTAVGQFLSSTGTTPQTPPSVPRSAGLSPPTCR